MYCNTLVNVSPPLTGHHRNRSVHVKNKIIHYCRKERDVMTGVHSSSILVGICIAFYGNVVQL